MPSPSGRCLLARASQLVRNIETRLDVTERLLSSDMQFAEEIPLDGPSSENISEQVAEYFGAADPGAEQIAAENTCVPQF